MAQETGSKGWANPDVADCSKASRENAEQAREAALKEPAAACSQHLLEQILAEQRKSNELLSSINNTLIAVTEGGNAMKSVVA